MLHGFHIKRTQPNRSVRIDRCSLYLYKVAFILMEGVRMFIEGTDLKVPSCESYMEATRNVTKDQLQWTNTSVNNASVS